MIDLLFVGFKMARQASRDISQASFSTAKVKAKISFPYHSVPCRKTMPLMTISLTGMSLTLVLG